MSVSVAEAQEMIKNNKDNNKFKIIDVRTGLQRCMSRIPGSQHVSLIDLNSRLGQFQKDITYLVYCRSGGRSASATNTLKQNGINAINMVGGMNNWGDRPTEGACEIY